ncbi:hypothetical protein [Chryseobacterium paludis]|uniref:hypothetical protein n=1 Tax=Chryseobacterium paludis TaxID=2956784 RepID=UPI0021C0E9BD|nr:hypothetical protein [Chryseobacterium paludis]
MQTRHLLGVTFVKSIDKFKPILIKQYAELKGREVPELEPIFSEKDCRHYYITESVIKDCKKIKVEEPFDLNWLNHKLDENVKQWSFGERFIRFLKKDNRIIAIYSKFQDIEEPFKLRAGERGINYVVFDFDLANKEVDVTEGNSKLPIADEGRLLFYQLLTFILLAAVDIYIVPPGQKHGTRKSPERLLNEEDFPFTIINSNWNKISINIEGFIVSGNSGLGFPRKQACGPGWKDRKLIWIEPFNKSGYVLGAKGNNEL